jgi:molybdate transport system substrate-binding protein
MLRGLSSMAARHLLVELCDHYERRHGRAVSIEFVGGVEAARRVQSGEAVDLVFLAADAIERLEASGHLCAGSSVEIARANVAVAVAVAPGSPRPAVDTEAALERAVREARSVGYSTGPSGAHLAALFERWGIAEAIKPRLVLAPPGVPVGELLARGEVALGFQQMSELVHVAGIEVLGTLPPPIACLTTFRGAVGTECPDPDAARAFLDFAASPAADAMRQRHGLEAPAR